MVRAMADKGASATEAPMFLLLGIVGALVVGTAILEGLTALRWL